MMVQLSLLLALFSNDATAFCGTYVGSAGADLFSHTSQVAIARQGNQTTLTLANDYEGSLDDFAVVIPVPSVLTESDVQIVEKDVSLIIGCVRDNTFKIESGRIRQPVNPSCPIVTQRLFRGARH